MSVSAGVRRIVVTLIAVCVVSISGYTVDQAQAMESRYGCCSSDCNTCPWGKYDCNPDAGIWACTGTPNWPWCCIWH